uniref:Sarcosine oxidase subunit gamma n=1 Tax=OCS116 cluster bacterium TaxID=2030921 RepID=A0A2A4Z5Y9_9PROT
MADLLRDMPLSADVIDYSELKIKPQHLGVVMVQQSDIVAKSPRDLPSFGNVMMQDGVTIFSAIPNQWLHICQLDKIDEAIANYKAKITSENIVISCMSDQYIVFEINGDQAQNLLAKGCELDLSISNFKQNSCARTLLAHLNVVIWRETDDGFKLLIDASFAAHLWLWLEGAALEFG